LKKELQSKAIALPLANDKYILIRMSLKSVLKVYPLVLKTLLGFVKIKIF